MFKYFIAVLRLLPVVIYDYFAWMLKYSIKPEKYPIEKRFFKVKKLLKYAMKLFNVVPDTKSFDEYNKESNTNHLIICNHQSAFDPLFIISRATRPTTVVAKKEARKYPIIARIIRCIDGEFLDREDNKQALRVFMRIQKRMIENKRFDVIIFPEGTRNKSPMTTDVASFHAGTFRPAFKAKASILVVSIYGVFRASGMKFKNKYNPCSLNVLKEYKYEDIKDLNTEIVSKEAHKLINDDVKTQKEKDLKMFKLLNN